ncbi:beta-lactamase, partial [Ostertagia ostertagi]
MAQMKDVHVDGTADDLFKPVQESFRRNFTEGWEKGGAAFAVYHKGRLVVDLWGGYADKSCNRLWNEDTMTLLFSCTKAGLPYFEETLTLADLTNPLRMATIIEQQAPKYPPGSKTAYHPITFGWLIDQVFCRIEPHHRTVGQFLREEIETKHHVDVHIGECPTEEIRIARFTGLNMPLAVREFVYDRKIAVVGARSMNPRGYFEKGVKNMRRFGKD